MTEAYTNKLLAYDQFITVQIGIYNIAEFGELVIEVWDKGKTKMLSKTDEAFSNPIYNPSIAKPVTTTQIMQNIFLDEKWRDKIQHAKGQTVEYILEIHAVPVRYTKMYREQKAYEHEQRYGDIYQQGNRDAQRKEDEYNQAAEKKDYTENKNHWNKTTSRFMLCTIPMMNCTSSTMERLSSWYK